MRESLSLKQQCHSHGDVCASDEYEEEPTCTAIAERLCVGSCRPSVAVFAGGEQSTDQSGARKGGGVVFEARSSEQRSPTDSEAAGPTLEAGLRHVHGSPDIIFGVMTGREKHQTRASHMLRTWCADVGACVFFSDAESENATLATVKLNMEESLSGAALDACTVPGSGAVPPEQAQTYSLAQLRFLPAIAKLRSWILGNKGGRFNRVRWLVMVDDDTYVFHRNLKEVLSALDHSTPVSTRSKMLARW
eukprot:6503003-Prymnesium_polylepis.2